MCVCALGAHLISPRTALMACISAEHCGTVRLCIHRVPQCCISIYVASWGTSFTYLQCAGADLGGGRWGARPPLRRSFTIQNALFNNIQAPVNHWAPTPGRNPVSAPDVMCLGLIVPVFVPCAVLRVLLRFRSGCAAGWGDLSVITTVRQAVNLSTLTCGQTHQTRALAA